MLQVSFHLKTVEENGIVYYHDGGLVDSDLQGPVIAIENSILILQIAGSKLTSGVSVSDGVPHHILLKYGDDTNGESSISVGFNQTGDDDIDNVTVPFQMSQGLLQSLLYRPLHFSLSGADLLHIGLGNLGSFKGCISDVRISLKSSLVVDSAVEHYSLIFNETAPIISGYTSKLFEILECIRPQCDSDDMCGTNPCQNEATCEEIWNEYTCSCQSGWAGTNCDEANFCETNGQPCAESGSCVNGVFGYECQSWVSMERGYVKATPLTNPGEELESLQLSLRTRQSFGTLFHMQGVSDTCFMNMQISNDKLLFNFQFGVTEPLTNAEIDRNIADGSQITIQINFESSGTVLVTINTGQVYSGGSKFSTQPTIECIAGNAFWIGGFSTSESSSLTPAQSPTVANPQPAFNGCVRNFRVNDLLVPLGNNFGSNLNFSFVSSAGTEDGCASEACIDESVCANGGECIDIWRSYTCDCIEGNSNAIVEILVLPSQTRPLVNK